MSFVEVVGFLASLFGLIFLFGRDSYVARQKKLNPKKYEEREKRLNDMLEKMSSGLHQPPPRYQEEELEEDQEEEEPKMIPLPVPVVKPNRHKPAVFQKSTNILEKRGPASSKVIRLVDALPDKRALLVAHILFGPPKGQEE